MSTTDLGNAVGGEEINPNDQEMSQTGLTLSVIVSDAVDLFHCQDEIIPKVRSKVVKSKVPNKAVKGQVKKKELKDANSEDVVIPPLASCVSVSTWDLRDERDQNASTTDSTEASVIPQDSVENFSSVVSDSFNPNFSYTHELPIGHREQFLDTICQQPMVTLRVYEMTVDEKERKKHVPAKKNKKVAETENPNDKYNVKTVIGTVQVDVSPFLTTQTVIEGWYDLDVTEATRNAGRRVTFFHNGVDEEELEENGSSPYIQKINAEYNNLQPRVFVRVELNAPLVTAEQEQESNVVSLTVDSTSNLPYQFMNGLDYSFNSSDFTQTFSLAYTMPLSSTETRRAVIAEGVLMCQGVPDGASDLDTSQPNTSRGKKSHSRPKSGEGKKSSAMKRGVSDVSESEITDSTEIVLPERPYIEWKTQGTHKHYFSKAAADIFAAAIEKEQHLELELRCVRKAIDEKDLSPENNFTVTGRTQLSLRGLIKPGKLDVEGKALFSQDAAVDAEEDDKKGKKKSGGKKKKHRGGEEIEDMPVETLQVAGTSVSFFFATSRPLFKRKRGVRMSDLLGGGAESLEGKQEQNNNSLLTDVAQTMSLEGEGLSLFKQRLNQVVQFVVAELKKMERDSSADRLEHLLTSLSQKGFYHNLKEELKPVLTVLIRDNFFQSDLSDETDGDRSVLERQLLNQLYVKLNKVAVEKVTTYTEESLGESVSTKTFPTSSGTESQKKTKAYLRLAVFCDASNDIELAHMHFRNAIVECNKLADSEDVSEQLAQAWREYAAFLIRRGSTAEAEVCLRKAEKLTPNDVCPYILHTALLCNTGRYLEALDTIRKAVHLVPEHPLALALQGLAHDYAEEDEDCLGCFEDAQVLLTRLHLSLQTEKGDLLAVEREDDVIEALLGPSTGTVGNTTVFALAQSGSIYIYLARFLVACGLYGSAGRTYRVELLHNKLVSGGSPTYGGSQPPEEGKAAFQFILGTIEEARWTATQQLETGVATLTELIQELSVGEDVEEGKDGDAHAQAIQQLAPAERQRLLLHAYSLLGAVQYGAGDDAAGPTFQAYFDLYQSITEFTGANVLLLSRNKGAERLNQPLLDSVACVYLGKLYEQSQQGLEDEEKLQALREQSYAMYSVFCGSPGTGANPYTWLGMGLSALRLSKFDEAQRALAFASELDDKNPLVWTYLALTMLHMNESVQSSKPLDWECRIQESKQAFHFALQCGLKDPAAFAEIGQLFAKSDVFGFAEIALRRSLILEENEDVRAQLVAVMAAPDTIA